MLIKILLHTSGTLAGLFCLICFVFTTCNLFVKRNKFIIHFFMSLSLALSVYALTIYSINDAVNKFRNTKNSLNYFENFYQPNSEYGIFEESNFFYKKGTYPYVKTSLEKINKNKDIQNEVFNFLAFFNEGYVILEGYDDKLFTLSSFHKNLKGEYVIRKNLKYDSYLDMKNVHVLEYESKNEVYKELLSDFKYAGFNLRSIDDTFKYSDYLNSVEHHIPISIYEELPLDESAYDSLTVIYNKYKNKLKFDIILVDKNNKETFLHYNYLQEEFYQNK